MRFAWILLGALAFISGLNLIVFSPGPTVTERYYYRTWPPSVAIAAAGVASIGVGVRLRRRHRR